LLTVIEKPGGLRFETEKFSITRGGKKTINVRLERDAALARASRQAAEWVLSLGGTVKVRVEGREQDAQAVKELPSRAFQIIAINVGGKKVVNDNGVENLRELAHVRELVLFETSTTNHVFSCLKTMTDLRSFDLVG